jgi:hypothetical protein
LMREDQRLSNRSIPRRRHRGEPVAGPAATASIHRVILILWKT